MFCYRTDKYGINNYDDDDKMHNTKITTAAKTIITTAASTATFRFKVVLGQV